VTPHGKDWEQKLPCAEFAQNDSYHTSIGCTPFFLNYGCHPRSPLSVRLTTSRVPGAHEFVKTMQDNVQMARKMLQRAQDRSKAQYDKHHQHIWYSKGEQVLLSTENLKLIGCSKFWPRYIGPFTITEVIDSHNYKLALPPLWRIHDVFHVAVLKPYFSDGTFQPAALPEVLGDDAFSVEAIHSHRQVKRGRRLVTEYLCAYADEGPESRTWETEKTLRQTYPLLLRSYQQVHGLAFKRRIVLSDDEEGQIP
jgi:hypothetical protein